MILILKGKASRLFYNEYEIVLEWHLKKMRNQFDIHY